MIKGNVVKSEKEYRQLDRLSASDLRLFDTNRRKFFKTVVMKQDGDDDEEYSKSLLVGDLAHTLLLEPHNFDSKYLLSICTAPPTGLMLAFTEALYKHTTLNTAEDGTLTKDFKYLSTEAHRDSGFKLPLETVLGKFKNSNAEDYYNELRQARSLGKTVVCLEDVSIAEKIVANVESHPFTREIFYDRGDVDDTYNELKLEDYDILGLPMKSMIDRLIPDHEKKTLQPYEFKVTWDNQNFYREYFLKRRADIQAWIYYSGLVFSKEKINPSFKDYVVLLPIFVVADSGNFYSPLKYQMTEKQATDTYCSFELNGRKYKGVEQIIEEILWAQENATWTYSKEEDLNNGFKSLN